MKEYHSEPGKRASEKAPGDESDSSEYGLELHEISARTDWAVHSPLSNRRGV